MKKLALVLLTAWILGFSSCHALTPSSETTADGSADGQTVSDTTNTVHEIPYGYYDDLWLSVGVGGHPWLENIADRQEPVGSEFDVMCHFVSEDENFAPENYEYQFTVSDPTVAEITRKNVLSDGYVNQVWLKGLKPGTIQLEFKMIHKETGGVYAMYVELTIVPAAE